MLAARLKQSVARTRMDLPPWIASSWSWLSDPQANKQALLCVQIWRRTSTVTTLWNYCYDHLLCDVLNPGDPFIDFIAVSEQARYCNVTAGVTMDCQLIT